MAAIRNSISLQDRMTPVFRSIIRSMDSTMRVMRNLDKQANNGVQSKAYRNAQRDIQRANNELTKMRNHLDKADKSAGRLASTTNSVASNASRMSSGGMNLRNLAYALYTLREILDVMSDIAETADSMIALEYRLGTYDTTEATGSQLFDASYLAAMRSRSDVESTASLASRILISGATNGNGAEAIELAEILNKASFIGGSSQEESKRALLQLSQGLSSGVLQGDELRAIREQAPGLTDTLAKGLSSLAEKGVLSSDFLNTTIGDLKALGKEGLLTSDVVVAAFKEMKGSVDETFDNAPKSFGQATTGIANIWKRWLKLMSQGDNAFARINEKAWELLEWLSSPEGDKFFEGLAKGVNFAVDCIFRFVDWIGSLIEEFRNLEQSTNIIKTALITLAVVGVGAAVYFAASWIYAWLSSAWPVVLVIGLVAALIYYLLETGRTVGEVVGGIAGAILFIGYLLWDIIVWVIQIGFYIVAFVWHLLSFVGVLIVNLVLMIVMVVVAVIQILLQLLYWIISTIVAIITTVLNLIYTLGKGLEIAVKGVILGIYGSFVALGEGVLGILYGIASAIDKVFGSDLATSVGNGMKKLGESFIDLGDWLKIEDDFKDIGEQWSSSYELAGAMYTGGEWNGWNFDDLNLLDDNIPDSHKSFWYGMNKVGEWGNSVKFDPFMLDEWTLKNGTLNPMDGWNTGSNFMSDLVSELENLNLDEFDMSNLIGLDEFLDGFSTDGIPVNGGDLDSVGSIKSDVDISDEDLKLLQEMAARDFLLNLQTVTPTANISFGDVRETADINQIMDAIQTMVEEELATTLITD